MHIRHFQIDADLGRLEAYLRERYDEGHTAVSWLPERLHDLLYRISAQETGEGRERSMDHIYLWEEESEIIACILPDGENIYVSVKSGFENVFPSLVAFSEKNCLPLFPAAEDGGVKFWFAVSDSLLQAQKTLADLGYRKYPEEEHMNCIYPLKKEVSPELPEGFRFLYGEDYPHEANKWSALCMGFHPDRDNPGYTADMGPYIGRKRSSLYPDSFECIVTDENAAEKNNVCAYCFVYIDRQTKTALIEPVSTREKYRHKGFGTAILHGTVQRCKSLGMEKCYVDSFGWRKDFYTAAGFATEDSIGFWYKTLHPSGSD